MITNHNVSKKQINIPEDGRMLAKLYATPIFPKIFVFLKQEDEHQFLSSNRTKLWTLAAVLPGMLQWFVRFETAKDKR